MEIQCHDCSMKLSLPLSKGNFNSIKDFRDIHRNHEIYYKLQDGVPYIKTRPMIKYIGNENIKKDLIGVEIGIDKALNAQSILETLQMSKLYMIDPYVDLDRGFLVKYRHKIKFIKKKSEDSVDIIPNNLDFVYIDGNHEYNYVKKDIELYWPKVKEGGHIGGHDFQLNHRGVFRAVSEFIDKNDIIEGRCMSGDLDWWIRK